MTGIDIIKIAATVIIPLFVFMFVAESLALAIYWLGTLQIMIIFAIFEMKGEK